MNSKIKLTRIFFILLLALGATGISTSIALAAQPIQYDFSFTATDVFTDWCSFPVSVEATFSGKETDFFDTSGALTRIIFHIVEQDTFTANGKTLVGMPYTYNIQIDFDSSGNITSWYNNGVVGRIELPDGSLFFSAGRKDSTDNPYSFFLSPDNGRIGDLAGFCSGLTP